MEAIKQLDTNVSTELRKKLDLFLINTSLTKSEQIKLIALINKIYHSGKES